MFQYLYLSIFSYSVIKLIVQKIQEFKMPVLWQKGEYLFLYLDLLIFKDNRIQARDLPLYWRYYVPCVDLGKIVE